MAIKCFHLKLCSHVHILYAEIDVNIQLMEKFANFATSLWSHIFSQISFRSRARPVQHRSCINSTFGQNIHPFMHAWTYSHSYISNLWTSMMEGLNYSSNLRKFWSWTVELTFRTNFNEFADLWHSQTWFNKEFKLKTSTWKHKFVSSHCPFKRCLQAKADKFMAKLFKLSSSSLVWNTQAQAGPQIF